MTDNPRRAPHCFLFDLDGTLIDTAPDLGLAANLVREDLGMVPLPVAQYRHVASCGARGLLKVALGITPEHVDYSRHKDRFLEHYRAHLSDGSRPFEGVSELLSELDRAGLPWGVVTNKIAAFSQPLLDDLGLSARCACLVSGDSTPNPKPAPDALLLAAKILGIAARECVYVGDDERDIRAGRSAQMRTVAARWGYLGENPNPADWEADSVIDSPHEILRMFPLRRAA